MAPDLEAAPPVRRSLADRILRHSLALLRRPTSELWRVPRRALVLRLAVRNRLTRQPVLGAPEGPVVSLTTFGRRTRSCHLAVEAITRGVARPGRLVLWVDDEAVAANPPAPLRRLVARGLEVRRTEDWGPHKKYYPAVRDPGFCSGRLLITADDDVLYPRWWLDALLSAAARTPGVVVALRARTIVVTAGGLAPYATWPLRDTDAASWTAFPTGVSGVCYPPAFQAALRSEGEGFVPTTPRADDIWLHYVANKHGVPMRQATAKACEFWDLPRTQWGALSATNSDQGGNDHQLAALYDHARPHFIPLASPGNEPA